MQLGFGEKKKANKPESRPFQGQGRRPDSSPCCGNSWPLTIEDQYEAGRSEVTLDIFTIGEKVNISGADQGPRLLRRHEAPRFRRRSVHPRLRPPIAPPAPSGAAADPSAASFRAANCPDSTGNKKKTVRNLEDHRRPPRIRRHSWSRARCPGRLPGGIVLVRKK